MIGYKSLSVFKSANGIAGRGQAWHHVVCETPENIKKYGVKKFIKQIILLILHMVMERSTT